MQLTLRAHKLHTDGPLLATAVQPIAVRPLTARFDERGGSIGRADTSTLALPDPERHISRTQAEVLYANGGFSIRNVGSGNPITVNGRPLKAGEDAPLCEGDEIVAGSYSLRAHIKPDIHVDTGADVVTAVPPAAVRLPEDFDPFAAIDAPRPLAHDFDNVQPQGAGLNTMFGLDRSAEARHDPLAAFMSGAPAQRSPALSLDHAPNHAAEPNHVPELHAAYSPPAVRLPTPAAPARPLAPQPARATSESADALWSAFCAGAGISSEIAPGLSPELMRQMGQLLQAAIGGTLRLVTARAVARQELKAEATLIQARGNNPLKFSPDARAALEQLLRPSRAYMTGPAAVDDAMNDLLAHAVGMLAGMRAAMAGVLDRFEPEVLQTRLGQSGPLDTLLPARRDARLWRAYASQHRRIREDAQDDFQRLFGKAFSQAYDEQAARISSRRSPP